MKHVLTHLQRNTIAYFALFVALGGTSYASVKLPQHCAAPKAATSAKASITCGGGCPAGTVYWAYIGAKGNYDPLAVRGNTPQAYQTAVGAVGAQVLKLGLGDWAIQFSQRDLSNCVRLANLTHDRGYATVAGYDRTNPGPAVI